MHLVQPSPSCVPFTRSGSRVLAHIHTRSVRSVLGQYDFLDPTARQIAKPDTNPSPLKKLLGRRAERSNICWTCVAVPPGPGIAEHDGHRAKRYPPYSLLTSILSADGRPERIMCTGSLTSNPPPNQISNSYPALVDARHDPALHLTGVLVPISAVLPLTLLLVSALAVDQQDGKVDDVEISEDHAPAARITGDNFSRLVPGQRVPGPVDEVACDACGQTVRPRHDPVAEVVDVAGATPPAGGEES